MSYPLKKVGTLNVTINHTPNFNPNFYGKMERETKFSDTLTTRLGEVNGVKFPSHGIKFEFEYGTLRPKTKVEVEISRFYFNPIKDNQCYAFFYIGDKVIEVFFYVNEETYMIDGGLQVNMWENVGDFESDEEPIETINVVAEKITLINY